MSKYIVVSRYYKYAEVECKIYEEDAMVNLIMSTLRKEKDVIMRMYHQYPPSIGIEKMCERLNAVANNGVNITKMIQTMIMIGNDLVKYEYGWGWYSVVRVGDGKQWR